MQTKTKTSTRRNITVHRNFYFENQAEDDDFSVSGDDPRPFINAANEAQERRSLELPNEFGAVGFRYPGTATPPCNLRSIPKIFRVLKHSILLFQQRGWV